MRQLNLRGNRVGRYEWGAEIICSLEVSYGSSWGWRGCVRTWGVKSLGGFGAVSRRSIGIYSVKTSWGTVIMYIHSYLHKWSTQASNGVLDVNGQNLKIGNILLWSKFSWFFDGEMIDYHYLKYSQSYIGYFIKFVDIWKLGTLTDFCKFGFFRWEMEIELSICW